MDNPILYRCFVDVPLLGVVDVKRRIQSMAIRFVREFMVNSKYMLLKIHLKTSNIGLIPLAFLESIPCQEKILGSNDVFKYIAVNFHGRF